MSKVIDLDEIERLEREEENSHYKDVKSKTTIKKDVLEVTEFGKALVELNNEQLNKLPISDSLRENIITAKNMQKIALKRQLQFIGKLLRKTDNLEEIQKSYDAIVSKDKESNLHLQRLENIRNNLLDLEKSQEALDKLISELPSLDIQKLRQLIRNHHKEVEKNKPRKSFKEIFQFLKSELVLK
ncbi:hypothetical protein LO80_02920 [Candidatus Francisella endociliophora]|uniref:Dual-action ribosomal maturation protein DarP n=1 Tax=Candidatus Francisella endociliophora TaxID=653937 RepID=A0A097EN89_9GAMM|nr:ribosome biogenesis factor YjgA [Francisella sp. FSC1006]AIT09029.1 hypothetical protein LO80_02920 [Francisella sp. FSC1006]